MKVRTKITLGLSFLLSIILLLSATSVFYLQKLTVQNQRLLKDNYRSLENVNGLQQALQNITASFKIDKQKPGISTLHEDSLQNELIAFRDLIKAQKLRISEIGEEEIVNQISVDFETLANQIHEGISRNSFFNQILPQAQKIQSGINAVYQLNQKTIEQRNQQAQETAQSVSRTMMLLVGFSLLIVLFFFIRFPNSIARPIERMMRAIETLKEGNYQARMQVERKDEFGSLGLAFNQMAERLEEYEQLNVHNLMVEKNRVESLIKKISEGIIGFDADFNLLFINPFAQEILQAEGQVLIGKNGHELAKKNKIWKAVLVDLLTYQSTKKRYARNKLVKGLHQDKPAYFIRKTVLSYAHPEMEDKLNGYVLMLKNITEYKEQDVARTNFIATVSHELKTPISAIKLCLKLLKDKRISDLNEEQKDLIESVEGEANRLLNITQELLNANEMEGGKIKLYPQPTDIKEVLAEAIDSVTTMAEDRNITLQEIVDANISTLLVDQDKLTWILINFLTNALKYGPKNSVVTIAAKYDQERLTISVSDQGTGIPQGEESKIFDRYYRLPGSSGKGTGLGLHISKEIVEQMEGEIGVINLPEKGAQFFVKLNFE